METRQIVSRSGTTYTVYADGRIWSDYKKGFLVPDIDRDGYRIVTLSKRKIKLHRLMLMLFDREPVEGEQSRHKDGDPSNNRISNLQWGNGVENWDDKRRHERATSGERHGRAKLTWKDVDAIRSEPKRKGYLIALAAKYGVSIALITKVRSREIWREQP